MTHETTWDLIASMNGLRILRVLLLKVWHPPTLDEQARILKPMKAVKGLDVFDVSRSSNVRHCESPPELGDVPFRVVDADAFCEQ